MIKSEEQVALRAIAICFKPYLKPEEAMLYCDLGRTQFSKKCEEYGIYKSSTGYYSKQDLDRMLSGAATPFIEAAKKLPMPSKKAG